MTSESVWERADVDSILAALFDIRARLDTLVGLIEGDDESEEETDS
jgi:hypothetical protein